MRPYLLLFVVCLLVAPVAGCSDSKNPAGGQQPGGAGGDGGDAPALPLLELTDDPAALDTVATATLELAEPGSLVLDVAAVIQPMRVTIPAGWRAVPEHVDRAPTLIVCRHATLDIRGPGRYAIDVLQVEADRAAGWSRGGKWSLAAPQPGTDVCRYARHIAGLPQSNWLSAQIGAWAVAGGCLDDIAGLQITVRSGFAGMARDSYRVWSYAGTKQAEQWVAGAGLDPADYLLFADNTQRYTDRLASYTLDDWSQEPGTGYSGNRFAALHEYRIEPAVPALVLGYLTHHTNADYRSHALKQLLEWGGMAGSDDELIARAMDPDGHRELRLLAIDTLRQRGFETLDPIRLIYVGDRLFAGSLAGATRARLLQAGLPRAAGESVYDWWQRVEGWSGITPRDPLTRGQLQQAANSLLAAERNWRAALMEPLAEPDADVAAALVPELSQRFPAEPQVVERLLAIGASHASADVRFAVVYRLTDLDETASDFAAFLLDRLANDPETRVRDRALHNRRRAGERAPDLVAVALRDAEPTIRATAVGAVEADHLARFGDTLLALAADDPDERVRYAAVAALRRLEHPQALAMLRQILMGAPPSLAGRLLQDIGNQMKTPEGFDLLATAARTHAEPEVRSGALRLLWMFRDFAALDVLLEAVRSDPDATVQMTAVTTAGSILSRRDADPAYAQVIRQALDSAHSSVRIRAARTAGQLSLADTTERLVEMARHTGAGPDECRACARALQRIAPEHLFDVWRTWLLAADADLVRAAVNGIIRHHSDHPDAHAVLEPLANHPDARVSREVQDWLNRG